MDIRDLCDHDICICGLTFTDNSGYQRTAVPHPGNYREWFRLDEYRWFPSPVPEEFK